MATPIHDINYSRLTNQSSEKENEENHANARTQEVARASSASPLMPTGTLQTPDDDAFPSGSKSMSSSNEISDVHSDESISNLNWRRRLGRFFVSMSCRLGIVVFFLIFVAIYCTLSFGVVPGFRSSLYHSAVLRPNQSDGWEHLKADIFLKAHFFNLTNPNEALKEGKPFQLQETGPYIYRIKMNKIDVVWNSNSTVSYREQSLFTFLPTLSSGSQVDILQSVDVPFLTLANKPRSGKLQSWIAGMLQMGDQLFTLRNVQDLLWGYQDNALHKIDLLKSLDFFNFVKPLQDEPSSFGFLSTSNATPTSVYNVYTGQTDLNRLNDVYSFNYQRFVNDSITGYSHKLHGSATGALFPPPVHKTSSLALFYSPLLRTLALEFNRSSSFEGLDTLVFKVPDSQFSLPVVPETPPPSPVSRIPRLPPHHKNMANNLPMLNRLRTPISLPKTPREEPYKGTRDQVKEWNKGKMSQSALIKAADSAKNKAFPTYLKGIASLEHVIKGAPLFVSFPHFLGADPELHQKVRGLNPTEEAHRTLVDVHPTTGVTSRLRLRYQVNAKLNLSKLNKNLNNTSIAYLPLLWIETTASLDNETMNKLKQADRLIQALKFVTFAIFALLCATAVLILIQIVIGLIQHATERTLIPNGCDKHLIPAHAQPTATEL